MDFFDEVRNYEPTNIESTSAGERLEYWRKSVIIISTAPVLGHGTGSIHAQFRQLAFGHIGVGGLAAANPHNQILATCNPLGLLGAVVLVAMWIAHSLFFFGPDLPAGIGLAVVAQNIISSQFNSSLFDYTLDRVYVLGVGVLGGMVLRGSPPERAYEERNQLATLGPGEKPTGRGPNIVTKIASNRYRLALQTFGEAAIRRASSD